jgi:hypothetical protein
MKIEELAQKVGDALGKAWVIAKKFWKLIALVGGAIAAAIIVPRIVGIVRKAVYGKADGSTTNFRKLDETHIAVKNDQGEWEAVELGKDRNGHQVTVSEVRAVKLRPSMPAVVEVKNAAFDDV